MNKFDEKYIRMAKIWATNSYCKRRQVGALIVKGDLAVRLPDRQGWFPTAKIEQKPDILQMISVFTYVYLPSIFCAAVIHLIINYIQKCRT